MSAKIYRLDEHRMRRRKPTGADAAARNPGSALDTALRAVAQSPTNDFTTNARLFQRTFKDAIERHELGQVKPFKPSDGDGT